VPQLLEALDTYHLRDLARMACSRALLSHTPLIKSGENRTGIGPTRTVRVAEPQGLGLALCLCSHTSIAQSLHQMTSIILNEACNGANNHHAALTPTHHTANPLPPHQSPAYPPYEGFGESLITAYYVPYAVR